MGIKMLMAMPFVLLIVCNELLAMPARPTIDRFDEDYYPVEEFDYYRRVPRTYGRYDSGVYYYPEYFGYDRRFPVAAPPPPRPAAPPAPSFPEDVRRQGSQAATVFEYTPLVRYKSTKAKRKKLFVPNLFG